MQKRKQENDIMSTFQKFSVYLRDPCNLVFRKRRFQLKHKISGYEASQIHLKRTFA